MEDEPQSHTRRLRHLSAAISSAPTAAAPPSLRVCAAAATERSAAPTEDYTGKVVMVVRAPPP